VSLSTFKAVKIRIFFRAGDIAHLPSMCETLGSIPSTTKKKRKKGKKDRLKEQTIQLDGLYISQHSKALDCQEE
jgi:hypothetical protein